MRSTAPSVLSRRVTASAGLLLWAVALPALAQVDEQPDQRVRQPLAVKQELIRDRVLRLEDQMYRLLEKLKEEEPDQARRLEQALRHMGDAGVKWELQALVEALEADRLDQAVEGQQRLIGDLEQLLGVLMSQAEQQQDHSKKIEDLKQVLERLQDLRNAETDLRDASRAAAGSDQDRADPEAQAAINSLLQDQQALHQQTRRAQADPQAAAELQEQLAKQQRELAEQAEQLARMLEEKDEPQAAQAAGDARQSMESAQQELQQGFLDSAGDEQEDAINDLRRALQRLNKKPPPADEEFDLVELSKEQERVKRETEQLAQQMQEAQQEEEGPAPGQTNVQQAGDYMEQAGQRLDQQQPAGAEREQQKALTELEKAMQQVQQQIDQLEQLQRQRRLAELKKKFNDMLTRQAEINRATLSLHEIGLENWKRREQLAAVEQSQAQRDLSYLAEECLTTLEEDGTTLVVPQLVEHIRDDMRVVSQRLGEFQVGAVTQDLQADIVAMLEDLLESIEQVQAQGEPPDDPQQQGESQTPPLLPTSAELKLLVKLQQRVFERTREHHKQHQEPGPYIQRIAEKQKDVTVMAQELAKRAQRITQPGSDQAPHPGH